MLISISPSCLCIKWATGERPLESVALHDRLARIGLTRSNTGARLSKIPPAARPATRLSKNFGLGAV